MVDGRYERKNSYPLVAFARSAVRGWTGLSRKLSFLHACFGSPVKCKVLSLVALFIAKDRAKVETFCFSDITEGHGSACA